MKTRSYRTILFIGLTLAVKLLVGCSEGGIIIKGVNDEPSPSPTQLYRDTADCPIPWDKWNSGEIGLGYTHSIIVEGPQAGSTWCRYTDGGENRG